MKIEFKNLWMLHPANAGILEPCSTYGESNFKDQCAIRMGVCLQKANIPLSSFKGARCYPGHNHNQSHILRAEELANWLKRQIHYFGKVDIRRNVTAAQYADKTGIALFRNFYGGNNQGDHIDLWNKSKMTRGHESYFALSQEVWFWEIT